MAVLFGLAIDPVLAAELPLKDQPHLRRPVAAVWLEPGKLLAVANQRSGSISIVDVQKRKVLEEVKAGERLADIAALPAGGRLLAVDEKADELLVIDNAEGLRVVNRIAVGGSPVSVAAPPLVNRISVASLWSRKLTILEPNLDAAVGAALVRKLVEIELPFNPRRQVILPGGDRIVVADAFGGNLALVDARAGRVISMLPIGAERIHALALGSGSTLHIAHQSLAGTANIETFVRRIVETYTPGPKTRKQLPELYRFEQLYSPNGNQIATLPVATLREVEPRLLPGGLPWQSVQSVGAEAGSLLISKDATIATVPGRNEIRFVEAGFVFGTIDKKGERKDALTVGKGPLQIVAAPDSRTAIVVNTFSDSLTIVDLPHRKSLATISLGREAPRTPADRGEELFRDARLSASGWMSCHSCHPSGHTTGNLADTLGDGTHGTPKRILTLLGTRITDPWAWNGEVRELNEQVRKSLLTTLEAKRIGTGQVADITAYLHTLPPPPPLLPATDDPADQAQLVRGQAIFEGRGCTGCHVPPLTYTSPAAYDVGLEDERGLKKFNPPSLRGVGQGYSFLHDGRATTLEEVFTVHGHGIDRPLSDDELADLVRFLRSL